MLKLKFKLSNFQVKTAYRAGKSSKQNSPCPVIMELSSTHEKISCFKTSQRLRDSDSFLSEDVSKAIFDIGKEKPDFQREKRRQGFAAEFSDVDVIVKKRRNIQGISSSHNAPTTWYTPVSVGTGESVAESTPVPVGTDEASAEFTPASVGSEDLAAGETAVPAGTGLGNMEMVQSGGGGRQPVQMPAPARRSRGAAANRRTRYSTRAK